MLLWKDAAEPGAFMKLKWNMQIMYMFHACPVVPCHGGVRMFVNQAKSCVLLN